MNSKTLRGMAYVLPRSKDNPTEIQRALNQPRLKKIGNFIKQESSLIPNSIIINLSNKVQILPTGNEKVVTIVFPGVQGEGKEKYAYVLDGQHRLYGFRHADGIEFDLPVVALYDAPKLLAARVFTDINSTQTKIQQPHLLILRMEIGDVSKVEDEAVWLVQQLAQNNDSPLHEEIKILPDDKKTWVKADQLTKWIAAHIDVDGCLEGKTQNNRLTIIKNYLKAIKKIFSDAWGDNKNYVLTKPMGIDIMLRCLRRAIERCEEYQGGQTTPHYFTKALESLSDCTVTVSDQEFKLTWKRDPFGNFASGKGRKLIWTQLMNKLLIKEED